MTYVISGIRGSEETYRRFLDLLKPKKNDDIFLLGNIINGGSDGISLIRSAMESENVFPIASECETQAARLLPVILKGPENAEPSMLGDFQKWLSSGGFPIADAFMKLGDKDEKKYIIEYLREEMTLIENLTVGSRTFILSSYGPGSFSKDKDAYDYTADELLKGDFDPTCDYYTQPGKYIIVGDLCDFTPDYEFSGKIAHIGSVLLMNHAEMREPCALRLDDMKEYYL